MSVTRDIARTYRAPREVLRRRVDGGPREDRALAILMAACLLIFVSRWPGASRAAFLDPSIPLEARLAADLMAIVLILPLVAYGVAALSHLAARLLGGSATWFEARMALFWSLLAVSPLWLLSGLVEGFIGPGPGLDITELLTLVAFVAVWGLGLFEVETRRTSAP